MLELGWFGYYLVVLSNFVITSPEDQISEYCVAFVFVNDNLSRDHFEQQYSKLALVYTSSFSILLSPASSTFLFGYVINIYWELFGYMP